jgi:tetratricopeptide (TPR) repeat protein
METLRRRRTVFAVTVVALIPFFGGVSALVRSTRDRRQQISSDWASRGDREMTAGRADRATEDYRSAQQFARDSNAYRLQIAEALVAGNHPNEARGQLLALWAETPSDGFINLELGRIAARERDTAETVRFYHAAIDGAWRHDAAVSRRKARIELATYLMAQGDRTKAQAELIALSDDLPPDAAVMTDTAALLLASGAATRAMSVVDKALTLHAHDPRALQLAGEAAFELGDFRSAARFLGAAANVGTLDADHQHMRDTSARILTIDPFARGISSRERIRRVAAAFHLAAASLDRCPADELPDLRARVSAASSKATERVLAHDPEKVDQTLSLVSEIEAATAGCGAAGTDDAALQLVLKQRRSPS